MQELEDLFSCVRCKCDEVNSISANLMGDSFVFFTAVNTPVKFRDSELCFTHLVSYFYILFHEASGRNYDFVKRRIHSINPSQEALGNDFIRLIHSFRTRLQHNLDYANSQRDLDIKNYTDHWFYLITKKNEPNTREDWDISIKTLLNMAIELLEVISGCLSEIITNEHKEIIIDDWQKFASKNYSQHDFEKVLNDVLVNLDLADFLDANAIVKKQCSSWKKELDCAPTNFDFYSTVYKNIEQFLLTKNVCSIDSKDIIDLGVEKTRIFELMKIAKELFHNSPCSKADLIERLKKFI